jgi:hypothetical protein
MDAIEERQEGEFTIKIFYDEDAPNPEEFFDDGKIHSFSTKHMSYDKNYRPSKWAIPLSYFEHGQSYWLPLGDMDGWSDMRWDGVRFAGFYEPPAHFLGEWKHVSRKRVPKVRVWARQYCDVYNSWANGDIYGYVISRGQLELDACWGFFGMDSVEEAVTDSLKYWEGK